MKITREWVERIRAEPPTEADAETARELRRFEEAVESGRSDGDVIGGPSPPPGPWPVRKAKEDR